MRVCFAPQTFEASGFLRCFFPLRELQEKAGYPRAKLLRWEQTPKGILLDYDSIPADTELMLLHQPLNDVTTVIRRIQRNGTAVVIDCDDDYVNTPTWLPTWKGLRENDIGHRIEHLIGNLRLADLVTVSTPALKTLYSRYCRCPVIVIRNGLDWGMWQDTPPPDGPFTIGYVGSLSYRREDMKVLRGLLPKWLKRHPGVKFVWIGKKPELKDEDDLYGYLEVPRRNRARVVGFTSYDDKWAGHIRRIHLGLAPLAMHPFNEGKSHLKGMEYNAVGATFVASPTESYRWWTQESSGGTTGLTALRAHEWEKALDRLYEDDQLRLELGREGRELARIYSIQERWREWDVAYRQALHERQGHPDRAGVDHQTSANIRLLSASGKRPTYLDRLLDATEAP